MTDSRSGRHLPPARSLSAPIVALIGIYRRWLSPALPAACRFHPTCSAYAAEAIETHGPVRGSALAARRLLRCHPWCRGGVDPVPPVRHAEPKRIAAKECA